MTQLYQRLLTMASVLVLFTMASAARADTYAHIDQLALDIQNKAGLLMTETRHYVHTAQYRHIREDVLTLRRLAHHVHQLAHHRGNVYHIQSDLAELDRTFHHVEDSFDRVERDASHGYGGHVHGATKHVKKLLNAIQQCIHHMQDDVRQLQRVPCGWRGGWEPDGRRGGYHGPGGYDNYGQGHPGYRYDDRSGYQGGVYYDRKIGSSGGLSIGRGPLQFQVRF